MLGTKRIVRVLPLKLRCCGDFGVVLFAIKRTGSHFVEVYGSLPFALRPIARWWNPVIDVLPTHKVIVDMIEPLLQPIQTSLTQRKNLLMKAAPELRVIISSKPVRLTFDFDVIGTNIVIPLKMALEAVLAIVKCTALFSIYCFVDVWFGATPAFRLEVLVALVPLPVVLAAK